MTHENQVHDFHPPVTPSGLYWVIPVPSAAVVFDKDLKQAVLELKGIEVIDQPKWPQFKAEATPARMDLRIEWKASNDRIVYNDPLKQFRVEGFKATARMEASIDVPSIGFSWKSDPLQTSRSNFAIIGREVNGKYFDELQLTEGLGEIAL